MNLKRHIVFLLTVFMFVGVLAGCTDTEKGLVFSPRYWACLTSRN